MNNNFNNPFSNNYSNEPYDQRTQSKNNVNNNGQYGIPNQVNNNSFYSQTMAPMPMNGQISVGTNNFNNFADVGQYNTVFNKSTPMKFNGIEPKASFNNHNFVNRNDLLFNNVNSNILEESIKEY